MKHLGFRIYSTTLLLTFYYNMYNLIPVQKTDDKYSPTPHATKRRWCSGNISDFHSEAPGSIPGRRKQSKQVNKLKRAHE